MSRLRHLTEKRMSKHMWIQLKWCDQCQLRRWTSSSLLLLLILSFTSLATGVTLNILPLALIVHKQMEKQKVELASLRRYWSSVILFCTSSSWSYTPHIHRCKPLPVDDGKRNPHPPTYTGILLSPEAVTRKDEQSKTAYHQYFDKRHGLRPLPDLQPDDSFRVKLEQQKGGKTSGKGIARSPTARSLCHPDTLISEWCVKTYSDQSWWSWDDWWTRFGPRASIEDKSSKLRVLAYRMRTTIADYGALQSDVSCILFCKHKA